MIKPMRPLLMLCVFSLILIFLLAGCAKQPVAATPAPQPTRDPILEQSIEQQLMKMDPEAVPVYQQATKALDAGDYEKSRTLYQQVLAMAPGFSTAYRRLGYIATSLNDTEGAEQLTRKAVELEATPYNQVALAGILLQKNTPTDSQEAFDLASEAIKSLPDDDQANTVLLMSAAAINNMPIANQASQHLLQLAPTNPVAHYFAGLLAGEAGRWEDAEAELLYARELGMDSAIIQSALNSGIARNALIFRSLRWGAITLVFWLLGLGALFLAGTYLSRATIRAINQAEPALDLQVKPQERRIRSIYRVLINILSLYFYISIPFVILTLLLVVGGVFYVFLVIGTFPIQLSIILVIMLIASLFAIARSLFSRHKEPSPGHELGRMDAPELWALVEGVARKLETRPVDSIYVTPGVGIAVSEKGSILQKLRGMGKRNLTLGMGVLPGLTQGQLAAILAHEYGHFSNRDTAGGDMAYLVYASLQNMAQQLIRARATQIFNPVWLFVMAYQRIFLRVTLGASRLQEVLADRYAATTYGSQNFIDGLKNVIRQTITFPLLANYEVKHAFELKQPVNNLYDLPMQEKLKGELEKQLDEAMSRSTSQYDSHPAPQERIAWIERLNIPYSAVQDNPQPALQLFPNPEQLQREMTAQIMKSVRR